MRIKRLFQPLLLAAICSAVSVHADEPLEEIIVSAGFRDSVLMKSAGSVSVVDEGIIANRAATDVEDIIAVLPNVNFSSGGSRARFIQIRGIGDLEQFVDPKHYPSVGITIDDIEMGSLANSAVLMDVGQIEVLRGPQGTRFGASALAGMLNIRTAEPTAQFSAALDSGFGNYGTWHLGGVLSGPLTDRVRGRLAVRQYRSDGFINNRFLDRDDTNDRDELALRGKLRWANGRGLQLDLTALYLDIDNGYDAFSLDNGRDTLSDEPGQDRQELYALGLKGGWRLATGLNAEARLSWSDADEVYGFDEDWVFRGFCDGVRCDPLFEFSSSDTLTRDKQQITFDVRLLGDGPGFSWVAGAYGQRRDENLTRRRFGVFDSTYETERYAAYGQLQLPVADRWQITAGMRYERFSDDYTDSNALLAASDDDLWSGEFTVEYFPSDQTIFYLTVSRGVKPGGVNTEASSVLPFMAAGFQSFVGSRLQFATESVLNTEIGVKGLYFNDRLMLRTSVFHMDRNNAQLESWMWDAANFLWVGILDSVKDGENYGAEVETNLVLNDHVSLFAGVGLLKTKINEITTFDLDLGAFVVRRNREQTKAPHWQFNTGVTFSLGDLFEGRLEVAGRGSSYFGYYHNEKLDGYATLNASLGYKLDKLQIRIWARNILDDDYYVHGLFFANDPRNGFVDNKAYYQFGDPRVYGVNLTYSF